MTALDASVLFGTVDRNGDNLRRSRQALSRLPKPFLTTEACVAEAMHLAGKRLGWNGQGRIWGTLNTYGIEVATARMSLVQSLMERYRDVPMDFADATLVALASEDPRVWVATFDSDFLAYRREDGAAVPLSEDRLLGWQ